MNKIKQLFHTISYLQYPLLLMGVFLIAKPIFKGYNFLSENLEYLFETYNNALIFLGLTLSFASLQDPSKTLLRYEQRIWRNSKKSKNDFYYYPLYHRVIFRVWNHRFFGKGKLNEKFFIQFSHIGDRITGVFKTATGYI